MPTFYTQLVVGLQGLFLDVPGGLDGCGASHYDLASRLRDSPGSRSVLTALPLDGCVQLNGTNACEHALNVTAGD